MTPDPWIEHLKQFDLYGLHLVAQKVGYRVRCANGWTFDLEYEGGLDKFYQSGYAIKTFDHSDAGKREARVFLGEVKLFLEHNR